MLDGLMGGKNEWIELSWDQVSTQCTEWVCCYCEEPSVRLLKTMLTLNASSGTSCAGYLDREKCATAFSINVKVQTSYTLPSSDTAALLPSLVERIERI